MSHGTASPLREHLRSGLVAGLVAVLLAAFGVAAGWGGRAPASPSRSFKIDTGKVDTGLQHLLGSTSARTLRVIVRESVPATSSAERVVRTLGGTVRTELPIIGGFSASMPARSLAPLAASPSVSGIWSDKHIRMAATDMQQFDDWPADMAWKQNIRLPRAQRLFDGSGVTVAVLDTGVTPSADFGSRLEANVDLSGDRDGVDHYGHGTHMAGIIAGDGTLSDGAYGGVAPGANLVSVKVAGWDGSTDVSVVIAGLEWVVTHQDEYDIRVLNLSFGTDGSQGYLHDPLDYAVEQVWQSGILVIVSAGNRGPSAGTVNKPGDDPFVVTVGAMYGQDNLDRTDDVVMGFSSRGPTQDGFAKPNLVAPGVTIVSDRAIGSTIEQLHQDAWVGDCCIKGTGTSQATAVVTGVAALMLQADPEMTPNVAKKTLVATAKGYLTGQLGAGAGVVDALSATTAALLRQFDGNPANGNWTSSDGSGSLEASRGSMHVYADTDGDGVPELVAGDIDVFGRQYSWNGDSWDGATWESDSWAGTGWDANSWDSNSWDGNEWDGTEWASNSWN